MVYTDLYCDKIDQDNREIMNEEDFADFFSDGLKSIEAHYAKKKEQPLVPKAVQEQRKSLQVY